VERDSTARPEPLTLLYVEDEQLTRDTVCSLIGRRFPELVIRSAENGALGLQQFLEHGADLVMTDIKMPVLNGIELARRIKAEHPATPVIVTSAHSDMEYFIESIEIGINRYVMKPIDAGKLFGALQETMAGLRLARELKAQQDAVVSLNQHLLARTAELELANRDLEAFSYTVSHDLRTPLTNINGYCQVILEIFGAGLDPKCREFIEIIFGETIAMNELIKTLLDFSRLSRKELLCGSTDLSDLAQATASALQMREPERSVDFRIAPQVSALCDPDLLRVVLDNLLGNAFKYTGRQEQAQIEFGDFAGDDGRVYFVRDNGAGFDMAQADKLFSAFQRLHSDREFKGFGIGLATVQRVIQRHGGRVWAEGAEGKGASFYFTLPEI
jgi:two-component system, sensor histidine kinase and response regulator